MKEQALKENVNVRTQKKLAYKKQNDDLQDSIQNIENMLESNVKKSMVLSSNIKKPISEQAQDYSHLKTNNYKKNKYYYLKNLHQRIQEEVWTLEQQNQNLLQENSRIRAELQKKKNCLKCQQLQAQILRQKNQIWALIKENENFKQQINYANFQVTDLRFTNEELLKQNRKMVKQRLEIQNNFQKRMIELVNHSKLTTSLKQSEQQLGKLYLKYMKQNKKTCVLSKENKKLENQLNQLRNSNMIQQIHKNRIPPVTIANQNLEYIDVQKIIQIYEKSLREHQRIIHYSQE